MPIKAAIFHSCGRNDLPDLRGAQVHPGLALMRVNHGRLTRPQNQSGRIRGNIIDCVAPLAIPGAKAMRRGLSYFGEYRDRQMIAFAGVLGISVALAMMEIIEAYSVSRSAVSFTLATVVGALGSPVPRSLSGRRHDDRGGRIAAPP